MSIHILHTICIHPLPIFKNIVPLAAVNAMIKILTVTSWQIGTTAIPQTHRSLLH